MQSKISKGATSRLTYKNGSGRKTLYVDDANLLASGNLRVTDVDGDEHIFSQGADWHLKKL